MLPGNVHPFKRHILIHEFREGLISLEPVGYEPMDITAVALKPAEFRNVLRGWELNMIALIFVGSTSILLWQTTNTRNLLEVT